MTSLSSPADHAPDRETGDLAVEGGVTGRDDTGPYVRLVVTREQVARLCEAGYAVVGVGGRGLEQDFQTVGRSAAVAEVRPDPEADGAPPVAEVLRGDRSPGEVDP